VKRRRFYRVGWMLVCMLALVLSRDARAAQTCEDWVIRVESVQGRVQAKAPGRTEWMSVELHDTYCAGVTVRVLEDGRAALALRNESVLRLGRNTTLTVAATQKEETSFLDVLMGDAGFFSRKAGSIEVRTPFVNAFVEGTEFFVEVRKAEALLYLLEGKLLASNAAGSVAMTRGQSVLAEAGKGPVLHTRVKPGDAVQWALYYPPVLDYRPMDFADGGREEAVRRSVELYWKGDLAGAFAALEGLSQPLEDPRVLTYRAGLFLTVGRVQDADRDIREALDRDPAYGRAIALRSVMAVTRNEKEEALTLARKAVEFEPASSACRVALSYAQQARFDIRGALSSLRDAVELDPANALAWARLSELRLMLRYTDRSLEAADRAVSLNPDLSRTQTVLGYARLMQVKTRESRAAFAKAIRLDPADPMPRLGLGLAKIRDGDLKGGRREIEVAVCLDPNNSLLRSYLGKAYFEEKRDKDAAVQFGIAKELDPQDPTPRFYDAIRKQTLNRPVEAMEELQKSIALNDHRGVYRSRLLLDEDLAARSAGLARIYDDLGFQWLAIQEGWKSLHADPANYSAHRFLADLYSALPRHEAARVSELLQSQLLQPLNIMPLQPQLAETRRLLPGGVGPRDPSYNEFTPLFAGNRLSLLHDGVGGGRGTFAEDVVHSGVWGNFSYSLGQFHSETDGFRPNNFLRTDVYDAFAQMSLDHRTGVQFEYRGTDLRTGAPEAYFDPLNFGRESREEHDTETFRFGFRHSFAPGSDLIGSFLYRNTRDDLFQRPPFPQVPYDDFIDTDGYGMEIQHLYRSDRFNLTTGVGHFNTSSDEIFKVFGMTFPFQSGARHNNAYLYSRFRFPEDFVWTVGVSADFFNGGFFDLDRQQFNPKIGVLWTPFPNTTLRGAAFRTFKRTTLTNQTIEPTQVAGFNQFYLYESEGADVWNYGIGLDQRLTDHLFTGGEFVWRDVTMPAQSLGRRMTLIEKDAQERLGRAYFYWAPHPWMALGPEYQYERFRNPESLPMFNVVQVDTHRVGMGIHFYHPSGFLARLRPTYVFQDGDFLFRDDKVRPGSTDFFVLDAAVGYRLPRRWGLLQLEAVNLFDESFRFQDTDPMNPRITPGRCVLMRWTVSF